VPVEQNNHKSRDFNQILLVDKDVEFEFGIYFSCQLHVLVWCRETKPGRRNQEVNGVEEWEIGRASSAQSIRELEECDRVVEWSLGHSPG